MLWKCDSCGKLKFDRVIVDEGVCEMCWDDEYGEKVKYKLFEELKSFGSWVECELRCDSCERVWRDMVMLKSMVRGDIWCGCKEWDGGECIGMVRFVKYIERS